MTKKISKVEDLIDFLRPTLAEKYDEEGISRIQDSIEEMKFAMDDGGRTLDLYYKYEWGADIMHKYCPLYIDGYRVIHFIRGIK